MNSTRDALRTAVDRIADMLSGDDGQAWIEARKALPALREALSAEPVQAEPVYQLQGADGRWIDQTRQSYDYNAAHRNTVRVLYAAPQPAAHPTDVPTQAESAPRG